MAPAPAAFMLGLLILFAGCAGSEAKGAPAASLAPAPPATATAETGSIEGTVVDEEQAPIGGVTVALVELAQQVTSDVEGRFVFNNLSAGSYRLITERLGFESVAREVDVLLGEVTPLKLVMKAVVIKPEPFIDMVPYAGLIQCSYNPYYAANPCGGVTGDDRDQWVFTVDTNFTLEEAVFELVWTPSSAATAQQMELDVCDDLAAQEVICLESDYYEYQTDPSPNVMRLDDLPVKKQSSFLVAAGAGLQEPTPVVQQSFTIYVSLCYFEECPEDYSALPK